MQLNSDELVYWRFGFVHLHATIAFTGTLMLVMVVGAVLVTRRLQTGLTRSRWQSLLELIVTTIQVQIEAVGLNDPMRYLPYLGVRFLFIAFSSL